MSLEKEWRRYITENHTLREILECKKICYSHQQVKNKIANSKVELRYYWCDWHKAFHLTSHKTF